MSQQTSVQQSVFLYGETPVSVHSHDDVINGPSAWTHRLQIGNTIDVTSITVYLTDFAWRRLVTEVQALALAEAAEAPQPDPEPEPPAPVSAFSIGDVLLACVQACYGYEKSDAGVYGRWYPKTTTSEGWGGIFKPQRVCLVSLGGLFARITPLVYLPVASAHLPASFWDREWLPDYRGASVHVPISTRSLGEVLGAHFNSLQNIRLATPRGSRTVREALTTRSLDLFLAYARDAANWSGTPLVGGNVPSGREERGNLTQLKRAGLVTTFVSDGDTWLEFTAAGRELASYCGVTSWMSVTS